jgi:hypothetical protein
VCPNGSILVILSSVVHSLALDPGRRSRQDHHDDEHFSLSVART